MLTVRLPNIANFVERGLFLLNVLRGGRGQHPPFAVHAKPLQFNNRDMHERKSAWNVVMSKQRPSR
jgi:hypothetical protein